MITVIPSDQRYFTDAGWLQSYWHFSFSDYQDPKNTNWSALRVFNDDIIQPAGGFGLHPHRDMEIVTYVIDGQLEHQDHLGNRGIVHPGEIQVMSAGQGIRHAEYNASKTAPVHLMQLWIMPRTRGGTPRWEQKRFSPEQRQGKLLPVVSSGTVDDTLAINQDATIYVSKLAKREKVTHDSAASRHGYLFVISGSVTLNDKPLATGDQARVQDESRLEFGAVESSEIIFLDLP